MKGDAPFFEVPGWAVGDLDRVGRILMEGLPPDLRALQEAGELPLPAGGNDPLRPYLVLLVARSLGCSGERAVRLAAGVQMIHLAALLHDRLGAVPGEVPLSAAGRKGERGSHQREAMDILLGDFMFSRASCIIIEDGEERIVRDMIDTSVASAEVQATLVGLQEDPGSFGPWRCFETAAEKLSLLLSLSLRVGTFIGNAPGAEREALSDFGAHFGKALRIVQDLACWERAASGCPGPPGPARYHLPMLLLWEREGTEAWWEAVRDLPDRGTDGPENLRSRVHNAGYFQASLGWARRYADGALRRLERLPGLPGALDLKALVRDLLSRGQAGVEKGLACVP